jgi:hypothetical protein
MSIIYEKIDVLKSDLVVNLWTTSFLSAGRLLAPRKTYKHLKVFNLTNARNLCDIDVLVENKISNKQFMYAWCYGDFEYLSLCTEGKFKEVLGDTKLEKSVELNNHNSLISKFPFHIISLDFSSQEFILEEGRLEEELITVEKLLQIQKNNSGTKKEFLLIFTTVLNSKSFNIDEVKTNSEALYTTGYSCNLTQSGTKTAHSEKITTIKELLNIISANNGYNLTMNSMHKDIDSHHKLFSVTCQFT